MNADILKRVVRAIADGSQTDLDRLAGKIVEAERKTGHVRLAEQLDAILKQPRPKRPAASLSTPDIDRTLKELPLSRRHGETLATLIPHDQLEHHMVLPEVVEQRFARIEAEYAARDRLRCTSRGGRVPGLDKPSAWCRSGAGGFSNWVATVARDALATRSAARREGP